MLQWFKLFLYLILLFKIIEAVFACLTKNLFQVVREALKNEMNVMIKSSPADLVTATDQKVEKMLIASIKEKYPSRSFIGEESVAAGEKSVLTDNPTWIIDPIDGTTNFVHRYGFRLSVLPVYTIAQLSFTAIHPGRCTLWRIV